MNEAVRSIVVAGPNGSGKSTLTSCGVVGDASVFDPDAVARNLDPEDPSAVAIAAGREVSKHVRDAIENRVTSAVETMLVGSRALRLAKTARDAGYRVDLRYVCVGSPKMNVARVAQRVTDGGHFVPDDDVARRNERSLANQPIAIALSNTATLHDNSGHEAVAVAGPGRNAFLFHERVPGWAVRAAYADTESWCYQAESAKDMKAALLRRGEVMVAAGANRCHGFEPYPYLFVRPLEAGVT